MKVLLINSNRYQQPYPVIPFGMLCIASAVESAGHKTFVLDLCFSKYCEKEIVEAITNSQPDLIGISIRNIDNASGCQTEFLLESIKNEIIIPCKKAFSGPIVIGGPAVGISGLEILAYFDLDLAIQGDGELAFIELIHRIEKQLPFDDLGGLIQVKNKQVITNNPPFFVENLDELPFINPGRYIDLTPYVKIGTALQVQSKRGCALKCTYCTYNKVEGTRYRLRNPERVAAEIEYLVKTTGVREIELTDSTFNIPLDHAKAVLRAIIAKKLNLRLSTMGINPGAVDEEFAELLKKAGFIEIHVGIEAGSDITLNSLGKNYTCNDLKRAGEIMRKHKLPIIWDLLLGAPGETKETLMETFSTIDELASEWDLINIGIGIRVYKNTPIAEMLCKENPVYNSDNFFQPVTYNPKYLSLAEIKTIVEKTVQERQIYRHYWLWGLTAQVPYAVLRIMKLMIQILHLNQPRFRIVVFGKMVMRFFNIHFIKGVFRRQKARSI